MKQIRVSVRRLVEFSLFEENISPSSRAKMQEGTRGHIARQQMTDGKAEEALKITAEQDGMEFIVQGRMDLYYPNRMPPLIEEIKLSSMEKMDAPLPAHRAQALVYGHMLCEKEHFDCVSIRIEYVTASGGEMFAFTETRTKAELKEVFDSLLRPFAAWEAVLAQRQETRDTSLHALLFPYPEYRAGQREMAVQVYTAIKQKKRLFASLPTGTGKSSAALFPALKAMGEGLNGQIFYLTARTTARAAAADALALMRKQGLRVRSCVITAKEKCCPMAEMRCNPEDCERAKGYYVREREALFKYTDEEDLNAETIGKISDEFLLCPFEFSLKLCETADVVICDYNYVFDPLVYLQRIFDRKSNVTLLVDEAHNLSDRAREMYSGLLSEEQLTKVRRDVGKKASRKGKVYSALSALIHALREVADENRLQEISAKVLDAFTSEPQATHIEGFSALLRSLICFSGACDRMQEDENGYRFYREQQGKMHDARILCLNIASPLQNATKRMNGSVFFSATLSPLEQMRQMLGGGEEDACFALPSPFPKENLLVMQMSISTRYADREMTSLYVAQAASVMINAKTGNYIIFFPSYSYLSTVKEHLQSLLDGAEIIAQDKGQTAEEREAFIDLFKKQDRTGTLVGLCVLGGAFSEGIDLPGGSLIGTVIVGVGLPLVCKEREMLRDYYTKENKNGFAYAYQYPGMHKVLQACGRVIRTKTDRGTVLLIDDRYRKRDYASLLPEHYHVISVRGTEEISEKVKDFWGYTAY